MPAASIETDDRRTRFSNGTIAVDINHMPPRFSIIDAQTSEYIIKDAFFKFILDSGHSSGKSVQKEILPDVFTFRYHELREPFITDAARPPGRSMWCFLDAPKHRLACWLAFDLEDESTRVLCRLVLVNQDTVPIKVHVLHPLVAGSLEPGNPVPVINGQHRDVRVFCNGYQSWSTTRTFTPNEKNFYPPVTFAQHIWAYKTVGFITWLKRPRGDFLSNSVVVISDASSKRSVTIGFASCISQHGDVIVRAGRKKESCIKMVAARSWADGKRLSPGGEMPSEVLFIQAKNRYPRCLDEYADTVASFMNPLFWDRVPFGYCTWYYYYSDITEAEMLKNLQVATDKNANPCFKIDYFQLDDGYQVARGRCGDWKNVSKQKFPSGLKHLAGEIRKKGLVPGLWIAPFNAMPGSDLARSRPEWLLRDKNNKPITGTLISMKLQHALDPTHPGVKEYLKDLFRYFIHEVGFKYIKIDFIYSAMLDGAVFYDADVTRVEAFREALSILREAAGNDVFILGCGAPMLESVGLVNGMRIGNDTAPKWNYFDAIISGLNLCIPGVMPSLANTITRSWMHKKFWINDPDCLLVRVEGSKLKQHEIMTELSVIGLSGGQVAVSEDMSRLSREQMRLISLVQPVYPVPAHSPDMFIEPFPKLYVLHGSSQPGSIGLWTVALLINWSGRKTVLACNLVDIGCQANATYHVIDFWEKRHVGTLKGNETLAFKDVPSHGSKLVRIVKDEGDDAVQFLGSTLHVVQGAVEISSFKVSPDKSILGITVSKDGSNVGALFIKLPLRLLPAEQGGEGYKLSDIGEGIYRFDVTFENNLDIRLKLQIA